MGNTRVRDVVLNSHSRTSSPLLSLNHLQRSIPISLSLAVLWLCLQSSTTPENFRSWLQESNVGEDVARVEEGNLGQNQGEYLMIFPFLQQLLSTVSFPFTTFRPHKALPVYIGHYNAMTGFHNVLGKWRLCLLFVASATLLSCNPGVLRAPKDRLTHSASII